MLVLRLAGTRSLDMASSVEHAMIDLNNVSLCSH
jgi:hypothetical protein